MSDRVSLCVTYFYRYDKRPTLYRIADYDDGILYPLTPGSFSSAPEDYNPKYLWYSPYDEPTLYSPVLKSWKTVQLGDEQDKLGTESFPFTGETIYEVAICDEILSTTGSVQEALCGTFSLPEGVGDNILLVIDQDSENYIVLKCKKNSLKLINGKYSFNTNLSDMIHAVHYLEQYVIPKNDVFDTSRFVDFMTKDNNSARTRYFYRRCSLPQLDCIFYLHVFEDYLPIFIRRYLRNSKEYGFGKSLIQKIVDAINDALQSQDDLAQFLEVSGYPLESIEAELPALKESIISQIKGEDRINGIIKQILVSDDALRADFIDAAKKEWLQSSDEDRERITAELTQEEEKVKKAEKEAADILEKIGHLQQENLGLEEKKHKLETITSSLQESIRTTMASFEESFGKKLGEYMTLANIESVANKPMTASPISYSELSTVYPDDIVPDDIKYTDDPEKAAAALCANLKRIGMKPYYTKVVSHVLYKHISHAHSFIVSSLFARAFASALSNSIDAKEPTRIIASSASVKYEEIAQAISNSVGRVILIENLLDYYCENIFFSINRDFKDKIFVYGVNTIDNLFLISKEIWSWTYGINSDVAFGLVPDDYSLIHVRINCPKPDKQEQVIEEDNLLSHILQIIGVPRMARNLYLSLTSSMKDESIDPEEYVHSLVAKLTLIFANRLSEEQLDEILESLPIEMRRLYFS